MNATREEEKQYAIRLQKAQSRRVAYTPPVHISSQSLARPSSSLSTSSIAPCALSSARTFSMASTSKALTSTPGSSQSMPKFPSEKAKVTSPPPANQYFNDYPYDDLFE